MLRIERADYRRSRDADLLAGLHARDPLALAEAYHRTSPAAHACARRLLGGTREVEALMYAVYGELWTTPPEIARLEGWVRSRCFRIGSDHLRSRDEPPAAPSLSLLLPDLPPPTGPAHDAAEEVVAALNEAERRALLLSHDQGMPTAAQDDPDASAALDRALMALAGSGEGVDDGTAEQCLDVAGMADWVLGLLAADRAAQVTAEVVDRPACASRSRALRRGRRRLEGLPAAPDLGQRVLATVLGSSLAAPSAPTTDGGTGASTPPRQSTLAPSSLGGAPIGPPPTAALPSALDEDPPEPMSGTAAVPSVQEGAPEYSPGLRDDPGGVEVEAGDHDIDHDGEPDGTRELHDVGSPTAAPAPTIADDLAEGPSPPAPDDVADDQAADEETADDEAPPTTASVQEGDGEPVAAPAAVQVDGEPLPPDTDTPDTDTPDTDTPDTDTPDTDTPDTDTPDTDTPRRGGGAARKILNVLAVIVVLAAGAGLGLLIGFLLVGGR